MIVQDECGNAHTEWHIGAMKLSTRALQAGSVRSFPQSGAHGSTWSGKAALNGMDEIKEEK